MNKSNKFSPEVRERAVRLVLEHRGECSTYKELIREWQIPPALATRLDDDPSSRYQADSNTASS